ncbi:MAG: hypothetical protein R2880_02670 [Deinococcales bacterium]
MIDIRPFEDETSELVKLINQAWAGHYLAKDWIPHYDEASLDWQILASKAQKTILAMLYT